MRRAPYRMVSRTSIRRPVAGKSTNAYPVLCMGRTAPGGYGGGRGGSSDDQAVRSGRRRWADHRIVLRAQRQRPYRPSPSAARQASPLGAHASRAKAGAAAAPAGWAATATSALALANATDLGALDGAKTVEVTLGLQMRDVEAVKAAIAAGQVMSRDAFVSQYAPSADQVSAAVAYLQLARLHQRDAGAQQHAGLGQRLGRHGRRRRSTPPCTASASGGGDVLRQHHAGLRADGAGRQRGRRARLDQRSAASKPDRRSQTVARA